MHTVVNAEVVIPHLGEARQTNEFHFTFLIPAPDETTNDPIPQLEFESYEGIIIIQRIVHSSINRLFIFSLFHFLQFILQKR